MSKLPDCLIVGGGVIGLTAARALAKAGASVELLEAGVCGGEASWAGAGVLTACDPHRQDALFQLRERSLSLFEPFCAELKSETGIDTEYERCGELKLIFDDNAHSIARSRERLVADRRMPDGSPLIELLTPEMTGEMEPCAARTRSMLCRQTAQTRNPRLLKALAASCRHLGVTVREHSRVESLDMIGDRVTGIISGGETIASGLVFLCAGAWSSLLDSRLEARMPVHPIRGQMVLLKCDKRPLRYVVSHGKLYVVPRRDGHVLIGSTEEPEAGFEKRNTAKGVGLLMDAAMRLAPGLADSMVVDTWSGLRPGTPDDRPYLGPVEGFDGLIAATGHYRSGLSLAPAVAEYLLAIARGDRYGIDLSGCRPGRA